MGTEKVKKKICNIRDILSHTDTKQVKIIIDTTERTFNEYKYRNHRSASY